MKVLWCLYAPLGSSAKVIEGVNTHSGTWIDAMRGKIEHIELAIACIASKDVKTKEKNGVMYYGVSGIKRYSGIQYNSNEIQKWKDVILDFAPDIIMIWGTEYGNGYSIIKAAGTIPVMFFIQGVIGRISNYPMGLLSYKDISKDLSVFSLIKWIHYKRINRNQRFQVDAEKKMIQESCGIITDNDWADSYYRFLLPKSKIYHVPLPVNPVFLNEKHSIATCERHSIFSIACNNPAKGIHILIKGLFLIKKYYPDVKLYLPGNVSCKKPELIYRSPYIDYISKLITTMGLTDNVVFCGSLSPEEMKTRLLKCNAFVMPSAVENHSSSLREAMYLGVPSVASDVGSVHEFVEYGKNAVMYRYEEYDVLADSVIKIFDDDKYASSLGENAFNSIRSRYSQDHIGENLMNVYRGIIQ